MSTETNPTTQLAIRPKASQQLASFIGMDANAMLDVIKVQCFKGSPANVSNEQLAAFVSIAAEMGVNPLLPGMLYAYPTTGGGIVPMMGPDGVYKKLCEHPDVDTWKTDVFPEDVSLPPTHAVTQIWRKGRERPLSYTAILSEWKVQSNPNWGSRPRHMLGIRSLKQCARQIIHGVPHDEDERVIMGETDITMKVREIPKADMSQLPAPTVATAAATEVLPPEKPARRAAVKPVEPKPAPSSDAPAQARTAVQPEPEPPKAPPVISEAGSAEESIRHRLTQDQHTEDTLMKMAKMMNLCEPTDTEISQISKQNQELILGDWDTAKETMDSLTSK